MSKQGGRWRAWRLAPTAAAAGASLFVLGCATSSSAGDLELADALQRYAAEHRAATVPAVREPDGAFAGRSVPWLLPADSLGKPCKLASAAPPADRAMFTLGMAFDPTPQSRPAGSQPATAPAAFEPPPGYWRPNVFRQMGGEFKELGTRDFWRGFKTSFWDLENALVLTAAMGASISIRETGVDDTIRGRIRGHRQLGDMDETVQILGNPGTHFAATGVLWLGSALTRDFKSHEVAQTLTQALCVNGVTTLLLKVSANTRAPDGEDLAWPSGHTSSAFTVAAVLNEYYGPWAGVPSLALAGLVGYQRLDSRVHDFSDVVFGAFLGYVVGSSIARDQKAQFPEVFGMKLMPYADPYTGATGLALYKSW